MGREVILWGSAKRAPPPPEASSSFPDPGGRPATIKINNT